MAGIGIEVWLQESGWKFGYRNRDRTWGYRNWDQNWVTGIEIEVGDEVGQIDVEIKLRLVDVMYCC